MDEVHDGGVIQESLSILFVVIVVCEFLTISYSAVPILVARSPYPSVPTSVWLGPQRRQ